MKNHTKKMLLDNEVRASVLKHDTDAFNAFVNRFASVAVQKKPDYQRKEFQS